MCVFRFLKRDSYISHVKKSKCFITSQLCHLELLYISAIKRICQVCNAKALRPVETIHPARHTHTHAADSVKYYIDMLYYTHNPLT